MAKYDISNNVPMAKLSKLIKVELAREIYKDDGVSKNEAARRVWKLDNKAGFESVEEDSAIQYIARRI